MASQLMIIDDHPLLALGLRGQLEGVGFGVEVLDPAAGPEALVAAVLDRNPDCVVIDLGMPFLGGGAALIAPLVAHSLRIVVLTGETDRWRWVEAAQAGADVVVSKAEPLDEIVDVIGRVAAGQTVRPHQRTELLAEYRTIERDRHQCREPFARLSRREREVLAGLMDGFGPSELAQRDFVSVETVRTQVKRILRKLQVGSQLEAVALANRAGWTMDVVTS